MTTSKYMILDNNHLHSQILLDALARSKECVCQVFTSPSQLLNALEIDKPDMIFCNVTARDCDCRNLFRNNEINLPFIFVSALKKTEERRRCFLNNDHKYISYPFTLENMQNICNNFEIRSV